MLFNILCIVAAVGLTALLIVLWISGDLDDAKCFVGSHRRYLRYVIVHKWYVFLACLWLKVPLHQAILHDWSKFLPSEWFPYATWFYGLDRDTAAKWWIERCEDAFDVAWLRHQNRQPHHWQYWLLTKDTGETVALEMPHRFVREMVADWMGAGKALGKPDTRAWYLANRDKMNLNTNTRAMVEVLLNV